MATLDELIDEQNVIRNELSALDDNPDTTEEDHGDLRDTLIQRWKALEKRKEPLIARMEDLKLIERAAADPGNRESGDGAAPAAARWGSRGPEFMQRLDPFAGQAETHNFEFLPGSEVIARAQTAIELHDKRHLLPDNRGEEASRAAQQPSVARHMLMTGNDDYLEAFRTYLNDPMGAGQVARAQLLTSTATAGYMLPYVLDTQIILTNSGSTNPYRRIARVVRTTSDNWHGVTSAGVAMAWLAEGGTATDSGSAVGDVTIVPQKAASWVTGSFEVMSDSDYASQLPGLLADAKDVLEESAFAMGTGGTAGPNNGQPFGVVMGLATAQRVASAGGSAIGAFTGLGTGNKDVYNLNAGLGPRFRLSPNVAWTANIKTINAIRALDQYGGSSFWVNLGADQPDRLLGKPIYESPSMKDIGTCDATGTAVGSAVAVFGDFSKYVIVDRIGSTMLFDPLLKSDSSQVPTGTQGWFYYWRVGAKVTAPNAFRYITNLG